MENFGDYEDWPSEWQETFDDIPGIGMFRDYEWEQSAELFERAFMHHSDESGYNADEILAAREEFFEYTGLPEELFPWDEWREAMGYGHELLLTGRNNRMAGIAGRGGLVTFS
jgi:hypothetical protein